MNDRPDPMSRDLPLPCHHGNYGACNECDTPRPLTQMDIAISYVRESWNIEREVLTDGDLDDPKSLTRACAFMLYLADGNVSMEWVCSHAATLCGGELRSRGGMNMVVGDYEAPAGGPQISLRLDKLLRVYHDGVDPVWFYHQFLRLHPFTDGNGRTARALWWAMTGPQWSFLQKYHYEVLRYMDNRSYVKPQENASDT